LMRCPCRIECKSKHPSSNHLEQKDGVETMQKAMLMSETKYTAAIVDEIQTRHDCIQKLEQDILELATMFRDLDMLVDIQQESVNNIEYRIQTSRNYTEIAEQDLVVAETYQKTGRNRQCCICGLCMLMLLIVAVIVTLLLKSSTFHA
jgi:syntaxin 1B/2/3